MNDIARTARVARVLALTAKPAGDASRYLVSGGGRTHLVTEDRWPVENCDCEGSQFGARHSCKHIYAVILSTRLPDVLEALRAVAALHVEAVSNHPGVRRLSNTRADLPMRRRLL